MDRLKYFERVSDIMSIYPELKELADEDNIVHSFIQYWARNDKYYDSMGGSEDALVDLIVHLSKSRQKLIELLEQENMHYIPRIPAE